MALKTNIFPIVFLQKLDRSRDCERGSGIPGPGPLQKIHKARAGCEVRCWVKAPAYDQRLHERLNLTSHKQECRTLGRKHPLMTIPKGDIRVQCRKIEWNLARGMCGVDDH